MRMPPLSVALPDRLETDRLVLRAPAMSDVPAIARLADNPKIHEMTTLPYPYGEADAVAFVENYARSETEHAYAICNSDGFIGTIGLHLKPDSAPELGYWLGEPFWGQGYATEAAIALVQAAHATGLCSVLYAKARSTNAASRSVIEKIGFKLISEGVANCGPHKDVSVATYAIGAGL
ncbi:GNAT family N-acetyltransferase [Pelagibacterium luteolum]|uniref:Protein N-acetyltransferase, RimJ/RimL family n=1 Tax=Pelagibacterium luteolum TaxID=440168 RepID=A0A1G7S8M4_9HYPH|nr:GNAT family N-acetyltransferase [Pelagibacterium luteolum]SDG19407.1 Protein N-acetyltransferase, RimJ/RimL family [Pelagibacterium luteolum]